MRDSGVRVAPPNDVRTNEPTARTNERTHKRAQHARERNGGRLARAWPTHLPTTLTHPTHPPTRDAPDFATNVVASTLDLRVMRT